MKKTAFFLLIIIISLTACKKHKAKKKATWIIEAYQVLESGKYSQIKAVNWWNENWRNGFLNQTRLRIDSSPRSLEAYQKAVASSFYLTTPNIDNNKLLVPISGMYHCAFPDFGGDEDNVTTEAITNFINLSKKNIVWASFSDNWMNNTHFPIDAVNNISEQGIIPYIRFMPKTSFEENKVDSVYTLQKIIDGNYDTDLNQWFIDAKNTAIPLLCEFGTEVNGSWFSWNGRYHGGRETTGYGDPNKADGPERFVDAFRHIINLSRINGANNITWFFHFDDNGEPNDDWNKFENYYPGDNYIDWIGVSAYGQINKKDEYGSLEDKLDAIYNRMTALTNKPIAILETGMIE
jgi:beta-mannanase